MLKNIKIRSILIINLVLTCVLIAIFSVIILFAVSDLMTSSLRDRGQTEVAALISLQTRNHVPDEIFYELDTNKSKDVFTSFFKEVKTDEILRIKVWDKNARIIAANDPSIIGKSFPENIPFQKSIKGEVVSSIKAPLGSENEKEQGYKQLMEVYVPIYSNSGSGEIIGVIETYTILDGLNKQILDAQSNLIVKLIVTSVPLIVLLGVLFFLLYRKVYNRISALSYFARVLGSGQLDQKMEIQSQDELSEIAVAMNKMAASLNESIVTKNDLQQQLKTRISEIQTKVDEVERMNRLMINRELKMVELKKELAALKGVPEESI